MLEIKDLNVFYGAIHALKGISLTVGDGELASLIGANGAGKTTTLHTISGLLTAASGSITLDGKNLQKVPANTIISMGLSPILVKEIFAIIEELHKSGITILLVEPNAKMALAVSDRAYVLETGVISMEGPAAQLAADDRVRKAYLGA